MTVQSIDARGSTPKVRPALPALGGTGPHGDSIAFTSGFMTFNGKPWLAVCGELHYSRLPRRGWETALRRMKACGVDIASTYVFWNHHEEEERVFDWSGDRDLRGFAALCARVGIFCIVRVGPFSHGEARNGGLPDWLYGRPFAVRSNDERYLMHVRRLYREIGDQLRGLFFQDGGPIIAVQIENELMHAGAPWECVPRLSTEWVPGGSGGMEHMRILKRLALDAGLTPPFFTCTAWGGSPIPEGEVLPLYGGYAFCPWNITESTPVHSPTREYIFRAFHEPGQRYDLFDPPYDPADIPFACCEIGGGLQSWYRYRAVCPPESVEAMTLVKLAGGCSLLGFYMFHGGSNPHARRGFLNEHVVPRISYDFQAPIGEFGQVRESYRRLRRLHVFLHDFTEELALTRTALPEGAFSIDPRDTETVRCAARVTGDSGFLFFNNYQDHVVTRDQPNVAVKLALPGGSLRIPRLSGFTLKAGACALMPFNLDMRGVRLDYSTAQPIARLQVDHAEHLFFFEHEGIAAEYCFPRADIAAVQAERLMQKEESGKLVLRPEAGIQEALTLVARGGARTVLHTLTERQSLGFHKLRLWGRDRIVISAADLFESDGSLALRVRGSPRDPVELFFFPALEMPLAAGGARLQAETIGLFSRITLAFPPLRADIQGMKPRTADAEISLDERSFDGLSELFLSIEYDGDTGNAFIDGRLVADDFANGEPWEIGLIRFRPELVEKGMYLHVAPRRDGVLVVRESGMARQQELQGKEIAVIRSVTFIPERELTVTAGPG